MTPQGTTKSTSLWLDTLPDQRRYSPLQRSLSTDVVVIGGGIVGIMTAWNLAARGRGVALLEKNHIATGDTGLTTAFLTRVPDTGAGDLLKVRGSEWLRSLFAATAEGQQQVKELVRRESIDCDLVECDSYNCSYAPEDQSLWSEWEAIRQADPKATLLKGPEVASAGVSVVKSAIRFEGEARFHVRKLLFGLLERPIGQRIQVFEETEVTGVDVGTSVTVTTSAGSVRCQSVVLATGLPLEPFPELQALVSPVLTFVVAARYPAGAPISENLFWDTDEPYQYFRRFDQHTIILGGADRSASQTGDGESPYAKLTSFLSERLPGSFDVTHQWSGTLFDTTDGLPYVAEHPHYRRRVFVATGFGGNGMAMGTMAGRILADLATGTKNPHAALFDFSRTGVAIAQPAGGAQAVKPGGFLRRLFGRPQVPAAAPAFVRALALGDLESGRARAVTLSGRKLALFRIDGQVHAIDNRCSHAGGPLCDGKISGTVVVCPWHGSKFDVTTGAVCGGPASVPQKTYRVRVTGDQLEVEV